MGGLSYGSVCSGIEAATVAWHPLGWAPSFFSEIEAAPRAVLTHRHPEVPLHGDFTTIREGQHGAIDLLVGGTPCQSFSVAGLRGGLADDRGNLALEYLRLAQRLRPRWLVWENVPGVLSSNGGRDFGAILGGMVELGYGFAYRVLDAQYVRVDGFARAVPQRRRRVFVVGHLGDWRRPAAVLLERACLRGDPAPRRGQGEIAAANLTSSLGRRGGQPDGGDTEGHLIAEATCGTLGGTSPGGGWRLGADEAAAGQLVAALTAGDRGISPDQAAANMIVPVAFGGNDTRGPISVATAVNAHGGPHGRLDFESETFIAAPLAFDTTQITSAANRSAPQPGDPCHPLAAGAHAPAIAFSCKDHGADATDEGATPTLRAMGFDRSHANAGGQLAIAQGWTVRRLTPRECERLQGFPDDYTLVPWRGGLLPDGPRYKALGNSMACNVMRWIGRRIEAVEGLPVPTPSVSLHPGDLGLGGGA